MRRSAIDSICGRPLPSMLDEAPIDLPTPTGVGVFGRSLRGWVALSIVGASGSRRGDPRVA